MNIIALSAGLLSGIIGAMGLGGGAVLIIYLTLFNDTKQITAGGINLLFFIPVAITAVIVYAVKKKIKYKTVIPTAVGGLLGALVGIFTAGLIKGNLLSAIFGIFLLVLGINEIVKVIKIYKEKLKKR